MKYTKIEVEPGVQSTTVSVYSRKMGVDSPLFAVEVDSVVIDGIELDPAADVALDLPHNDYKTRVYESKELAGENDTVFRIEKRRSQDPLPVEQV